MSASPTEFPQQPPQSAAGRGPKARNRPPRMRSSCDECAAAKVRCNKDKPRCERCARSGAECIYGISLKRGRGTNKAQPPQLPSLPTPTVPGFDMDLQRLYSEMDLSQWDPSGFDNSDFLTSPPLHSTATMMEGSNFEGAYFDVPFAPPHLNRTTSSDYDSFDDLMVDTPLRPTKDMEQPESSTSALPSSQLVDSSHRCYEIAHCALESLSFRPPPKTSLEHGPDGQECTLHFDDILRTNKSAINTLNNLINCWCARSPHMALLCSSMATRIIFWHRVAVGSTVSYIPQQMSGKQRTLSISLNPMTMGTYIPDAEEQKAMQRLALQRDLKRLSELLETFGTRSDFHHNLCRCLKAELKQAAQDVSSYGDGGDHGRSASNGSVWQQQA